MAACAINLFSSMKKQRFNNNSYEADTAELSTSSLSYRRRLAVMHRRDCKHILERNIRIFNILTRILALIHVESVKNPQMTKEQFRLIYMEPVPEFEHPDEVLMNRIRIRKYLLELVLNQRKAYEMLQ